MLRTIAVCAPIPIGLAAGALIGGPVAGADPALAGWILGAGAGLTGGAFVAALAANVPLAGRGGRAGEGAAFPGGELGRGGGDAE